MVLVLVLTVLPTLARPAGAGSPASSGREAMLPRACRGGSHDGLPCTDDAECAPGRCGFVFVSEPFSGIVTFIVDDDVSQFDGSADVPHVVAVTALLEVSKDQQRLALAQTYQNLRGGDLATLIANLQEGPVIADTGASNRVVTEASLD